MLWVLSLLGSALNCFRTLSQKYRLFVLISWGVESSGVVFRQIRILVLVNIQEELEQLGEEEKNDLVKKSNLSKEEQLGEEEKSDLVKKRRATLVKPQGTQAT
ncbi:hypothetical protein GG344DRAFT_71190 [Lentinula edodes]|nr:hypothetical protein GG344DRAFT_71190 [Lentinula edodes]